MNRNKLIKMPRSFGDIVAEAALAPAQGSASRGETSNRELHPSEIKIIYTDEKWIEAGREVMTEIYRRQMEATPKRKSGATAHMKASKFTQDVERGSLPRMVRRNPLFNPGSQRCRCGHVRNSHNCDQPWARSGNTACRHDHCDCEAFAPNAEMCHKPGGQTP